MHVCASGARSAAPGVAFKTAREMWLPVQGECYLLCVDNEELRAAMDPGPRVADGPGALHGKDIAAVFWQQWSAGKPILVKNVQGKISWEPKVGLPDRVSEGGECAAPGVWAWRPGCGQRGRTAHQSTTDARTAPECRVGAC